MIYTKGWNDVKIDDLRKAVDKTFEKRDYTGNIEEVVAILKDSEIIKNRWDSYKKKYEYATGTFITIINKQNKHKCVINRTKNL